MAKGLAKATDTCLMDYLEGLSMLFTNQTPQVDVGISK